jgi:UDPglucose 6-dehydrogenase
MDTSHPDRVIIGANEQKAIAILRKLHAPLCKNILVMKPESAQMAKYASNSYLATRITFINQIANLCEANGANIQEVIKGIGQDKRIGSHYWYPGLGYGGSCFPKDVKELAAYARAVGQEDNLMVTISHLNEDRINRLFHHFGKQVGGWSGKKVTILGLSFKPNTDDMREAPSTKLIPLLLHAGAVVTGYDPLAMDAAEKVFGSTIVYAKNPYIACKNADVIILLVEWKELLSLDLKKIVKQAPGCVWIDIRNQYEKDAILGVGMQYLGVGIQ